MSQNVLTNSTTPPLAGATAIGVLNLAADSLAKWFCGSAAPTAGATGLSDLKGFVWHDTSTNMLKVRDQADANWIVLGYFDETAKTFTPHLNGAQFYAQDTGAANAYAVAPTPAWTAYDSGLPFAFIAGAGNTSTGASTINVSALGSKALVRRDGSAIQAGDIVAGTAYPVTYDGASVRLLSPSNPPIVRGVFSNLKISAAGGTKTAAITADSIGLADASGDGWLAAGVNVTLDLSTSGAGGLDTGSVAANTWYAVHLVKDGASAKALGSLSATAPTMPAGDTYRARVGWVRTDGSSNIVAFVQYDRRVQYINTGSGLPLIASGVAGSFSTPTYVSLSISAFVPTTASRIILSTLLNNGTLGVAPNGNFGAYNSTNNYPPIDISSSNIIANINEFGIESTNIYWFSSNSLNRILCLGWQDNV